MSRKRTWGRGDAATRGRGDTATNPPHRPIAPSPSRRVITGLLLLILFLSGCGLIESGSPRQIVPGGDVDRGRELLDSYGCDACHTIPRLPGAIATVGPPLENWAQRAYIAGALPNNPDNLMLWIQTPQAIEPGTAMPNLGVTEQEARDIAAFMFDAR